MPITENRIENIEDRLSKLDKFKTSRQISKEITSGKRPIQHLGKKSKEVILQEFFSIKNSFKPDFFTKKEKSFTVKKLESLSKDLRSDIFEQNDSDRIEASLEVTRMLGDLR